MKRAYMMTALISLAASFGTVAFAAVEGAHHDASVWSRFGPLVWSIINFAILVYLLYRFGGKRVSAYLQERREKIHSDLEQAEKARNEADEEVRQYREKLENIEEHIRRIIDEVKEVGEEEKNRIIESAQQAVEHIKKEARRTAEEELSRAADQLREEMASLSTQMAEELLRRHLTPDDQHQLIRHYLEQMAELS